MVKLSRSIALIGLMGAGKSAVARVLAERLSGTVADLDARIEAEVGCTIAELFAREGESAFREREARVLRTAIAEGFDVIACGGGAVLRDENRELLAQRCRTVWLDVAVDEAARRVEPTRAARPLAAEGALTERLDLLIRERWPLYAEVAIARIDTTDRDVDEVAELVLDTLEISCA